MRGTPELLYPCPWQIHGLLKDAQRCLIGACVVLLQAHLQIPALSHTDPNTTIWAVAS